ncbi:hypothetical protein SAMN05443575_0511 [Jatrophihabitans endophyticus]|uniref:DUF2332 domain-containing protein n=1 Tax=Jatrophihabitans endophyticus TaxID=1206085 RepID=A0A1M5DAG3_9ACTN|nr:DUF2332 domain-containing protein [Jatrophihabitans endophyticus]SHF63978.1 hypothetical protein SAMN05443575_0511 [Jatrophihabitans endophyticus]
MASPGADWIGGDGRSTASTYRAMAADQLHGVSPSYERICLGIADDTDVQALIDRLPRPKRQPNLLLAAVRHVGGPVSSWEAFREFVHGHWDDVEQVVLTHATQTNEAGRCAVLLPVLAALPQPLALLEVGASAGLCLYPDRYGYRYHHDGGETRLGEGPPVLSCRLEGAPPPSRRPEVVWRAGLDLNPLDVTDDEDVRWLESLVWPEQAERFDTLRGALAVARRDPARVVRGDLTRDVAELAAAAPADATLVVFHTAVLPYVPADARGEFVDVVRALARRRPTVWLANEGRGVVLPGAEHLAGPGSFVLTRDGEPVAVTAPHGGHYAALAQ